MVMTMAATTTKKTNQNIQQINVRRERFACWRSSQDSLERMSASVFQCVLCLVGAEYAYVCLSSGRPEDDTAVFRSSSRWTAMEKRFQKEGSRMTAMFELRWIVFGFSVCVRCFVYRFASNPEYRTIGTQAST